MIQARRLTKRYGRTLAVDQLSFEVGPGRVSGFLGPNGAGRFDVWPTDMRPLFAGDGTCNWPEGMRRYSYHWWHADDPNLVLRVAHRGAAKLPGLHWSTRDLPLPYLVQSRQRDQLWWGIRSRGPGLPIYVGSTWFSLSAPAMDTICSAPRKVVRFFHHVASPDEACFHTALANARGLTFAPGNARYVRWEGKENPELLTGQDLAAITGPGAHFARKFDELVDPSVLDQLDLIGKSGTIG